MKNYIKISESHNHYCSACGKRFDDESMEEKVMYDISFVQEYDETCKRSQGFNLCWNCTKELGRKMEEARYNSVSESIEKKAKIQRFVKG